jgi:hypothetical protein
MATLNTSTLAADCKTLTLVYTSAPGASDLLTNEISGVTIYANVAGGVVGNTWTITSSMISLSGVLTVSEIVATVKTPRKYLIGTCELDCCVADLLQTSIDCACNCSKCDDDLRKAEKIHLLSESAKYAVINNNITDAINKYKTAKNFCDETCGCGC